MNANELKIGNYVTIFGYDRVNEVTGIVPLVTDEGTINNYSIYTNIQSWKISMLRPIPLTEDWLLRFGFQEYEYQKGYFELEDLYICKRTFELCFYDSEYGVSGVDVSVKHVHQLQNLYFSLTGKELIYEI